MSGTGGRATHHPLKFEDDFDEVEVFLHDVPEDVIAESAAHVPATRRGTPMSEPWPLERLPYVPMRFVLLAR